MLLLFYYYRFRFLKRYTKMSVKKTLNLLEKSYFTRRALGKINFKRRSMQISLISASPLQLKRVGLLPPTLILTLLSLSLSYSQLRIDPSKTTKNSPKNYATGRRTFEGELDNYVRFSKINYGYPWTESTADFRTGMCLFKNHKSY